MSREWQRETGTRYPRATVEPLVRLIEHRLAVGGFTGEVCGSWRRGAETCKDLDVVVVGHARQVLEVLAHDARSAALVLPDADLAGETAVLRGGPSVANGVLHGLPVDVWGLTSEAELGAALVFATGPGVLNVRMRYSASRRGLLLNQYGVWQRDADPAVRVDEGTEESVFAACGWKYLTPEQRESTRR